jgi:hypothetical protein
MVRLISSMFRTNSSDGGRYTNSGRTEAFSGINRSIAIMAGAANDPRKKIRRDSVLIIIALLTTTRTRIKGDYPCG